MPASTLPFQGPAYFGPDPDRDYANGDFIAGAASYPTELSQNAAAFRQSLGPRAVLDLPYGQTERQRFDLFLPESQEPRGTVIFIHGGYWLAFGRESWSHLAKGAVERGWAVVMPSYTLAPQARIHQITAEMAALTRQIAATRPGPVIATGHSAGGQLSARLATLDLGISRVVPISPLAELQPLIATKMNAKLQIDLAEAASESPARLKPRPGVSAHVWVGGDERPAFLQQARLLSEEWACPWTVAPGRHHFDVVGDLCQPRSALTDTLLAI